MKRLRPSNEYRNVGHLPISVHGVVRAHGSDDERDVNDDRGDHRAKAKSKNHVEPKWLRARDMVLVLFCCIMFGLGLLWVSL